MRFLGDRLQRLRQLSPPERSFLIQAWCALLAIDLALQCLPFTRVTSFCRRLRATPHDRRAVSFPAILQLAPLVTVAGRYSPIETSCLKEALALAWLLSRRGVATTLRFGVARCNTDLDAHAWLEHDGQIILGEGVAESYAPLLPLTGEAVPQ